MACPYRRTKLQRKRKKTNGGKERKRQLKRDGSTPSLDDILGPVKTASKKSAQASN